MESDWIVIFAVRGDPLCILKQIDFQKITSLQRRKIVFVGPIFGSANLVCSPKRNIQDHPDTLVLDFIAKLLTRRSNKVFIMPAKIDAELITGDPAKSECLLSGSETQKQKFFAKLRMYTPLLTSVCVKTMKVNDLTISRSSQHTKEVEELLKSQPKTRWPTAYLFTKGNKKQLCEPLWSSTYSGHDGYDLWGILTCVFFEACKANRDNPEAVKAAFVNNAKQAIREHQDSVNRMISVCANPVFDVIHILPDKANLQWADFKIKWVSNNSQDLSRAFGRLKKYEIYNMLDHIAEDI
jgi:hypothetical protein